MWERKEMMENGERGEGDDEREWKKGGEGGRGRGNDKRGWERGFPWVGEVEMVEMGGKGGISGNG